MIQRGKLQQVQRAAGRAALGIAGTEDDALHARMNERAGAHGARLLGDVERAVGEPPVAGGFLGLGEGEHLRVGGGIAEEFHLIEGAGDDASGAHDDGADGNLPGLVSARGLAQGLAHEVVVAVEVDDPLVHAQTMPKAEGRMKS